MTHLTAARCPPRRPDDAGARGIGWSWPNRGTRIRRTTDVRAPGPARHAVAAVVVAAVVGLGGWFVSRRIAEEQAVHDVAELTDVLADERVQPALTDAMVTEPVARTRCSTRSSDPGRRAARWSGSSCGRRRDDPLLRRATAGRAAFALDDEAREALTPPHTEAASAT